MSILERNLLLMAVPEADLQPLLPLMNERVFPRGSVLELPGSPVKQVYFLRRGFASILIEVGTRTMEVGLVGREGMLGLPAVLGSEISAYRAVVREDIQAIEISVERLREFMGTRPALGAILLRYMQAGVAQITYTAFANAQLTIAQRLARWLLMAEDRIEGHTIQVTHTVLSEALGVQRSGVTNALHELEGDQSLRSMHGAVTVLDRPRLIARALGAYGPAESAYRMLLGRDITKQCRHHRPATSLRLS